MERGEGTRLDNNLEPSSSRKGRDGPPPSSVVHSTAGWIPLASTQDPCPRRVPAATPWLRSPSPSCPSLSFFISSSTGGPLRSAKPPPRSRSLAGDVRKGLSCAGREIWIAMGQVGKVEGRALIRGGEGKAKRVGRSA